MNPVFPRVPHLPGSQAGSDDVHLDSVDALRVFQKPVIVLEKLDGLNVAVTRGAKSTLTAALRSHLPVPLRKEVLRYCQVYIRQRETRFLSLLRPGDTAYGEWLLHRITLPYDALDDVFVVFAIERGARFSKLEDVIDRTRASGLAPVRPLFSGHTCLEDALGLIGPSQFGPGRMEGILVEGQMPGLRWSKWVDPSYVKNLRPMVGGAFNLTRKPSLFRNTPDDNR